MRSSNLWGDRVRWLVVRSRNDQSFLPANCPPGPDLAGGRPGPSGVFGISERDWLSNYRILKIEGFGGRPPVGERPGARGPPLPPKSGSAARIEFWFQAFWLSRSIHNYRLCHWRHSSSRQKRLLCTINGYRDKIRVRITTYTTSSTDSNLGLFLILPYTISTQQPIRNDNDRQQAFLFWTRINSVAETVSTVAVQTLQIKMRAAVGLHAVGKQKWFISNLLPGPQCISINHTTPSISYKQFSNANSIASNILLVYLRRSYLYHLTKWPRVMSVILAFNSL